jgi:hypothetical protein
MGKQGISKAKSAIGGEIRKSSHYKNISSSTNLNFTDAPKQTKSLVSSIHSATHLKSRSPDIPEMKYKFQ